MAPSMDAKDSNKGPFRGARWHLALREFMPALLAVPALWPLISEGLPRGQDTVMHLMRLGALDHQIRHGTLYPRWLPGLMLGHGYPLLNFYGPLSYYLAEGFRLAGFSYTQAFSLTYTVWILLAAYGMFTLARDVFGKSQWGAALVAAIAYVYAPYLLTNIYIRGAIAEAGAQALLPWVLWSARRLLYSEQPARYIVPMALILGGLAITHNITLLFAAPFVLAYVIMLWWQGSYHRPRKLFWSAVGLLAAMCVSAFFWLPLVIEQGYLDQSAYRVSTEVSLLGNSWTWDNFLDASLVFSYSNETPFRLGLIQIALSVAGFVLRLAVLAQEGAATGRRSAEWWFFLIVTLLAGLAASIWALPIWLDSRLLQITQFQWRLLSIISLPLALFTGGTLSVFRIPSAWWGRAAKPLYCAVSAGLLVLIIFANRPIAEQFPVLSSASAPTQAVIAQLEVENKVFGASGIQEFKPRWAGDIMHLASVEQAPTIGAEPPPQEVDLALSSGNAYGFEAKVAAATGGPLRFNQFFFPGWRVILDRRTVLRTYPSTSLGLLTIDLPPGIHELSLSWAGTTLQHVATGITLLTLVILAWCAWRPRGRRRWSLVHLGLFGLTIVLACTLYLQTTLRVWKRALAPVQAPPSGQLIEADGARFLGFWWERDDPDRLLVCPYWYVSASLPASLRVRWQLQDTAGRVLVDVTSQPYFNAYTASNWSPRSVVNDAYELLLPPGLPAGVYRLALALQNSAAVSEEQTEKASAIALTPVGTVELTAPAPVQAAPTRQLDARLGATVRLAGFDVSPAGTTVRAGQDLDFTLYWQALQPVARNYHGFLHLVDARGRPLTQVDQLPGPSFRPPMLWTSHRLEPDSYRMPIPKNAPSGLYWPMVGLYDYATLARLPVHDSTGQAAGDTVRLTPIKVLGPARGAPQHRVRARLGDLAALLGYDLTIAPSGLRAGEPLTLTLYYESQTITSADLTRFVHLYCPANSSLAAQNDSAPADGSNPTWSWLPGEVIAEQVSLTIANDARPGICSLNIGFYDAQAGGQAQRLPVYDEDGQLLPDNQVTLTEIEVLP